MVCAEYSPRRGIALRNTREMVQNNIGEVAVHTTVGAFASGWGWVGATAGKHARVSQPVRWLLGWDAWARCHLDTLIDALIYLEQHK